MLGLNFKVAKKLDVEGPLSKFLSLKFPKTEADKHESSIASFASLRNAATNATSASEAGSESLRQYYVQIACAAAKFPISESGGTAGAQLGFTWSDTFIPGSNFTQHSWLYEKACVLFNIAALYTQMASGDRSDDGAIAIARHAYSRAAGILMFIQTKITPRLSATELPFDLTQSGLIFLQTLLLAQVQSLYFALARLRGEKNPSFMNHNTLARLAIHAADLYRQATKELEAAGDVAIQIEGYWPWKAHCESSAYLWEAVAYRSQADEIRKNAETSGEGYGEEIAWLRLSERALKDCIAAPSRNTYYRKHNASGMHVNTDRARDLLREMQGRLAEAVKDNAKVYFQPIPTYSTAPPLSRLAAAKVTNFEDVNRETLYTMSFTGDLSAVTTKPDDFEPPADLFDGILSLELAKSVSLLEERLKTLIGEWKERADRVVKEGESTITDLGLPGSLDTTTDAGPSGLPDHVWDKVKKIQLDGGVRELQRLQDTYGEMHKSIKYHLQLCKRELDHEHATDVQNRTTWGSRWTPLPSDEMSKELRDRINQYEANATQAHMTDVHIAESVAKKAQEMEVLHFPKSELDKLIPSVGGTSSSSPSSQSSALSSVRAEIRTVLDNLQTAMSAIPRLLASADIGFDRVEAQNVLSRTPAAQQNTAIDGMLQTPWQALKDLDANLKSQAPLRDSLRQLYKRYRELCEQDDKIIERNAAIDKVLQAVNDFEEFHGHLQQGEEFWTRLKGYVDTHVNTVREYTSNRERERRQALMAVQEESTGAHQAHTAGSLNNTGHSLTSTAGNASPTPSLANSFASHPNSPQPVSTNPFDNMSNDLSQHLPTSNASTPGVTYGYPVSPHTSYPPSNPPTGGPQSNAPQPQVGYPSPSGGSAAAISPEAAVALELLKEYGFQWEDLQNALKASNGNYDVAVSSLIGDR